MSLQSPSSKDVKEEQVREVAGNVDLPEIPNPGIKAEPTDPPKKKEKRPRAVAEFTAEEIDKGLLVGTMKLVKPKGSTSECWKCFGRVIIIHEDKSESTSNCLYSDSGCRCVIAQHADSNTTSAMRRHIRPRASARNSPCTPCSSKI